MRRVHAICLPLLLIACASTGDGYPSLALRPEERGVQAVSTAGLALPDPSPPSAAVLGRIAAAVEAAGLANRRFNAALPVARREVAAGRGAGVDSTAYAAAQVALGNLQSISSGTAFALADLDALLATRSNDLQTTAAVAEAQAQVAALLAGEVAAIETLERSLR
ncbi:hypothetical protein [Porphyrobacter sp. GA68]|uniref:hypothetical protein n=1 Tax=Porphyrobacter sp. GA68 TaxID=2883480 RepID=UPI001D18B3BA|nr:hypothetical protein [Porphyrobacter sp. GA68]